MASSGVDVKEEWYSHSPPSYPPTGVYDPRAFILHAASLGQACAHCQRFSTAASRRSLGSVSVPVCGNTLSGPVPVIALVSRYLTNKLIGPEPLHERQAPFGVPTFLPWPCGWGTYPELAHFSVGYAGLEGRLSRHYSPFRRFTPQSKLGFSLDLHA